MTPKRKVNPLLHQWARDVSLQPCVAFRMYGGGFFFFRNRASRQSYIEIDSIDPHTSTWCKDMMYTYIHVRNPSSLFGRWWLRGKKNRKKDVKLSLWCFDLRRLCFRCRPYGQRCPIRQTARQVRFWRRSNSPFAAWPVLSTDYKKSRKNRKWSLIWYATYG